MEQDQLPNKKDLDKLEVLYERALSSVSDITWNHHYPDYPASVKDFFHYITSSSWCNQNYQAADTPELINNLNNASIVDIQSILTAASRGERFCDGCWQGILQKNTLDDVIKRAKIIIDSN